jgi:hypothetical protein
VILKSLSRFATLALVATLAALVSLLLPTAGRAAHARNGPTANRVERRSDYQTRHVASTVAAQSTARAVDVDKNVDIGKDVDIATNVGAHARNDSGSRTANARPPGVTHTGQRGHPIPGESSDNSTTPAPPPPPPDTTARGAYADAQQTAPMRC